MTTHKNIYVKTFHTTKDGLVLIIGPNKNIVIGDSIAFKDDKEYEIVGIEQYHAKMGNIGLRVRQKETAL